MASLLLEQPEPVAMTYPRQRTVPCYFMRGGSSRGGFFLSGELPGDPLERAALLLAAYGSPDLRQIDGIGGSDPLTSKAAIIAPSDRPDADVEYTFVQVGIDTAQISVGGNCGNMIAAVGPYAILRGLVPVSEPETAIRIFTTNTGQVVTARIPISDGAPAIEGDCHIPGVPAAGARIGLDFGDCAGAVSGKLLPTGQPRDMIDLGGRPVEVSLVDAATAFVFVRAADIGARGTESAAEIAADAGLQDRLEQVRGWAATVLGLARTPAEAKVASPNVPRVIMVAPPQDYAASEAGTVRAADADLCVRQMSMQRPHKALAVTGSVCTAVASAIEGTVVAECASAPRGADLRLGHPSGVLQVRARVNRNGNGTYRIEGAEIERTARLIMAGALFVPEARIASLLPNVNISGAKPAEESS
jgi:2-methylaconitate cis-trans-isomerase PrpF